MEDFDYLIRILKNEQFLYFLYIIYKPTYVLKLTFYNVQYLSFPVLLVKSSYILYNFDVP